MSHESTHAPAVTPKEVPPDPGMRWIPGGTFRMGSEDHYPEEGPVHEVHVDGLDRRAPGDHCPRGEVEDRIKELKLGMQLGRTSCSRFLADQFRVLLTAAA